MNLRSCEEAAGWMIAGTRGDADYGASDGAADSRARDGYDNDDGDAGTHW